jgi:hypothetical protein
MFALVSSRFLDTHYAFSPLSATRSDLIGFLANFPVWRDLAAAESLRIGNDPILDREETDEIAIFLKPGNRQPQPDVKMWG